MRKIEQEMLQAIRDRRSWQSGNTAVFTAGGIISVYLHGHRIATSAGTGTGYYGELILNADRDTLRQWPTATTKSRLRALGIDVQTKKGVTYLDGESV